MFASFFYDLIFCRSIHTHILDPHILVQQKDRLLELFHNAVARQTDIMVMNILGHGVDIPLLGLREACKEVNGELCELFTDETYGISQCFLLSTSQVSVFLTPNGCNIFRERINICFNRICSFITGSMQFR